MGQIDDVSRAVTMDLKEPGNFLYQVGRTKDEMGGSHFALVQALSGGQVPKVDGPLAKRTFDAVHRAIDAGLVRACHDLSEGGLAVAAAEMAFAGDLGARVFLASVPNDLQPDESSAAEAERLAREMPDEEIHPLAAFSAATALLLFAESNSRFLCEVRPRDAQAFEAALGEIPSALVGEVTDAAKLEVIGIPRPIFDESSPEAVELAAPCVVEADLRTLREAWQRPLQW
jgi:phosphoribosylformylglycinamidine synthase